MREITIQNNGPIHNLTIPFPPKGVVVLKGKNGAGKTKATEAVLALLSGDGSLTPRDGTLSGEVEGLGCRIRIGRRTTRSGELEVLGLEGCDPSLFVEPGLVDLEAADAVRVRELCRLARITIDDSAWAAVAGSEEELAAIARPKTLAERDPVVKAKLLKADFDAAALAALRESDNWVGSANAILEAIKGVDLAIPCDAAVLRAEEDAAGRAQVEVETRAKGAAAAARTAESARQALSLATEQYKGPTVDEADALLGEAEGELAGAESAVHSAEKALADARAQKLSATQARGFAVQRVQAAKAHVNAIAGWQSSIEAAANARPAPPEQEITDAAARVFLAHEAADRGAVVRAALDKHAKAQEAADRAAALKERSERLRERAKACEGVLTEAISRVAPRGLRFQEGRLVLDTDRGETFLGGPDGLSLGERWTIGLDIAIDSRGDNAVIVIDNGWQPLDPEAKRVVAAHAETRGAVILATDCTEGGELRAEIFEVNGAAVAS